MTFEDEVIDLLKDIRRELQGGGTSSNGNTGGGNQPSGNTKKSKLSKEDIIKEIEEIFNKGISTYKEYQLSDIQKQIINTEAIYKKANITLESNLKILTNNIKLGGDSLVNAFKSSYASLTNGIDAAVSAATDSVLSLIVEKGKIERENYLNQLQRDNKLELTERERQVKYQAESNKQTMSLVNFGSSLIDSASNILPPIWKTVTQAATSITQNIVSTNLAISQAKSEAELKRLQQDKEFYEKQQEAFNQIINQQFEFAQNIAKVGQDLTNSVKKYVKDGDKLFNKTAIELGLNGNNIEQFIKEQFEQGSRMVLDKATNTFLNWSNDQRAKFQQGYSEKTGFAISLTENDQFKAGMLSQLWGEDTVNEISSAMQLYNHSVSDSVDMMNEMYNLSRQNGLSQSKFSKELAKNLKLAEKHQFKGGVKGLMEMTAWAQKMRFNMDEFGSVLNKIKDGGLEGVIEQAANLQVLGGNFAMGSDPLAMLWETYNDPQALGKRLHGMVRGMGTYNDKTGEVDFNMQDQLMLQSMAKATGQSVESLMNMSRQNVKRKYLENAITNGNYSDAQKELIYAKATKDEYGKWQVNGKDINRLEASDFAELEGTDQGILENVKRIANMLDEMAGAEIYNKNRAASDNYDEIKKQNDNIIQKEIDFYDNLEPIKKVIKSELEFEVNSLKQMHDITNKYADILPDALALLEKQRKDTFDALDGDIEKFRKYVHYLRE